MEAVDFNVEKPRHIVPRTITKRLVMKVLLWQKPTKWREKKAVEDDEVVLIKPIQTLPSSVVLEPSF